MSFEKDVLLTEEQCAAICGIEPRTVREWRLKRSLPFIKPTKRIVRIRKADLHKWLEKSLKVIAS